MCSAYSRNRNEREAGAPTRGDCKSQAGWRLKGPSRIHRRFPGSQASGGWNVGVGHCEVHWASAGHRYIVRWLDRPPKTVAIFQRIPQNGVQFLIRLILRNAAAPAGSTSNARRPKREQMPATASRKLLTIVESSAMLDPHLKPTNAKNWLADMRRKDAHYRAPGVRPPQHVKHNKVWHYPIEEIDRVIVELVAARARI
jgi:hypothetical protein